LPFATVQWPALDGPFLPLATVSFLASPLAMLASRVSLQRQLERVVECRELVRLAALVPRPKLHLIRFHGVLAPNAKLRAMVAPQQPEPPAQAAPPAECEASCAHHRPVRLSWARLLKRVFELDIAHCPNCGGD